MKDLVKIMVIVVIFIGGITFAARMAQEEQRLARLEIIKAANSLNVVKVTAHNCTFSCGGSLLDVVRKVQDCYMIYTFAISRDGEVKYIGKVLKSYLPAYLKKKA